VGPALVCAVLQNMTRIAKSLVMDEFIVCALE
jgi:hypothetical protein